MRIFIDKTEQDMLTTYTLTHMTNTWVLGLHPGIDDSFKCRQITSALRTIKAFESIHSSVLSFVDVFPVIVTSFGIATCVTRSSYLLCTAAFVAKSSRCFVATQPNMFVVRSLQSVFIVKLLS